MMLQVRHQVRHLQMLHAILSLLDLESGYTVVKTETILSVLTAGKKKKVYCYNYHFGLIQVLKISQFFLHTI